MSDDSEYNATDSDDDYGENEKILLENVRNRRQKDDSDSEEEVFGVGASDSDDDSDNEDQEDDHSDIALSDIEGEEDDDLPDTRAWGKDKRKFYASDDLGGSKGKAKLSMEARLEMMEQEEEEADRLHKEQMAEFDDEDFMPMHKVPSNKTDSEKPEVDELEEAAKKKAELGKTRLSKAEISKMTTEEAIAMMNKICPLFLPIINDHKSKMERVVTYLEPIIEQFDEGKIPDGPAMDFVHHYYREFMKYSLFVKMFKILKAEHGDVNKHPIVEDLFQCRKSIEDLEPDFQSLLPEIKRMLALKVVEVAKTETKKTKKTKKRKLDAVEEKTKAKTVKFDGKVEKSREEKEKKHKKKELEEKEHDEEDEEEGGNEEEEGNEKKGGRDVRKITYQMKKNKGLTPHRKKEQRNPRVKHKNRFRKAKINRKGAVREVRTEMSRYGGEASGINPYVVKSRKVKY